LTVGPDAQLVALGDVFADNLQRCLANLDKGKVGPQVDVKPEACFVGFDAYKKVVAAGVDIVILAAPSAFRPSHLEAAIAAGKHVFAEKPVAIDSTGVRHVLELADQAKKKKLSVVVGYNRRYSEKYQAFQKKLRNGTIGPIKAAGCQWRQTAIW